jgi:serine/threonine-protein kinase
MTPPTEGNTLVPVKDRRTTGARESTFGLPADVVSQSARRLRILASLYAFVYAMAAYLPALLIAEERARMHSNYMHWVPAAVAITVALLVAFVMRARVELPVVMKVALLFEIVSSYGIATGEFHDPAGLSTTGYFGLSWVAVWTLLFTVVVPTPPRRALVAALASVSAVPVVIAISFWASPVDFTLTRTQFVVALVFPYLLVVLMAYVGARVVYALGTEVSRARELGSYHLIDRLGHGGMGEVWRAKHRLLARPAAIKLIRPSATSDARSTLSDAARQRFEREAQVTASLRSPHTVNLFDFGVADDGTFYYVMELLEGLDVDALVRRTGPVPAERAIYIVKQICHSLAEAEAHGLVHRDIKPANIFLCRYGEDFDFVKVLDFGIVKASADDKAETIPALTVENTIQGTPAFIAPEQALGGSTIDGRADIYATGCVAYWLLTGELVFSADTPLGLVMQHVNTPPTPPSGRTELPIPPALDRIVLSCLAKDPAQRPQTAKELASRLASVDMGAMWTDDRARVWWETHRLG